VYELGARRALEVMHFNIFGHELNPIVKLDVPFPSDKRLRDFFYKTPEIREFLKGADKRDDKMIEKEL